MEDKHPFDADNDIKREVPLNLIQLIGALTVAWASYDAMVTYFLLKVFNTPMDTGSMLVSTMSTDSKLNKVRLLHEHYGYKLAASGIKDLRKEHDIHAAVRNIIAHHKLVGVMKSSPETLCYTAIKHVAGKIGEVLITQVPAEVVNSALSFAQTAERGLMDLCLSEDIDEGLKPARLQTSK